MYYIYILNIIVDFNFINLQNLHVNRVPNLQNWATRTHVKFC